jgi:hypothetical protein
MEKPWSINYTVTRYMGEGIEVLVQSPSHGNPLVTCRRTTGDWDLPTLAANPAAATYRGELSPARIEGLYRVFAAATVGAVPPSSTAIDSDAHFLVFVGGGTSRVEYQWSIELPANWSELNGIVGKLTALAEEVL